MLKDKKTCLIVGDDEISSNIASDIAEKLRIKITHAFDGKQALELCKDNLPDVILLDLYMPEMDGINFLGEMRKLEAKQRLGGVRSGKKRIVAVLCGADDKPNIVGEKAVDFDAYIQKPICADTMQAKFREAGLI